MRVVSSTRAVRDIEHITLGIWKRAGEHTAHRFFLAVRSAVERIGDFPEIGSTRFWRHPSPAGLRCWPVPGFPNYLIIYRIEPGRVKIVRVIHGASQMEQILRTPHD